ncbi:hypothetical protein L1987_19049 [Smallanthus sonchifolius]|uniref:Uncharacterized protein n=1 Tax=Smallanthus sonchifolius TaxID=185202 RepID=A0ACB9J1F3_9ASTR|nr:hypothetical protein L1987_19049 [Smallanthus sonchifolius]
MKPTKAQKPSTSKQHDPVGTKQSTFEYRPKKMDVPTGHLTEVKPRLMSHMWMSGMKSLDSGREKVGRNLEVVGPGEEDGLLDGRAQFMASGV